MVDIASRLFSNSSFFFFSSPHGCGSDFLPPPHPHAFTESSLGLLDLSRPDHRPASHYELEHPDTPYSSTITYLHLANLLTNVHGILRVPHLEHARKPSTLAPQASSSINAQGPSLNPSTPHATVRNPVALLPVSLGGFPLPDRYGLDSSRYRAILSAHCRSHGISPPSVLPGDDVHYDESLYSSVLDDLPILAANSCLETRFATHLGVTLPSPAALTPFLHTLSHRAPRYGCCDVRACLPSAEPSYAVNICLQLEVRDGRWMRFLFGSEAARMRVHSLLHRLAFPPRANLLFAFTQTGGGALDKSLNNQRGVQAQQVTNPECPLPPHIQLQQWQHRSNLLGLAQPPTHDVHRLQGTSVSLELPSNAVRLEEPPLVAPALVLNAEAEQLGWQHFDLRAELETQIANCHIGLRKRFAGVLGKIQATQPSLKLPTVDEIFNPANDITHGLRLTEVNHDFKLCPSYPPLMAQPGSMSDEVVHSMGSSRSKQRILALSWANKNNGATLWRCSQPRRLMKNQGDKLHFQAIQNLHFPSQLFDSLQGNMQIEASSPVPGAPPPSPPAKPSAANLTSQSPDKSQRQILSALYEAPKSKAEPVLIVDCRSYAAALANTATGGGVESFATTLATVKHADIANIHVVRKAFQAMVAAVRDVEEAAAVSPFRVNNFGQQIDAAKWTSLVGDVLLGTRRVALELAAGRPCVVHCSDGWDRTSQLCALAKLLIDRKYRSLEGFLQLIELDFLQFGHRFHTRLGMVGGKEAGISCQVNADASAETVEETDVSHEDTQEASQVSQVFLQFLDCVFQIMRQFPCEFAFRPNLLTAIAQACYSGRFGTFLFDTQRERVHAQLSKTTPSFWTSVLNSPHRFANPAYAPRLDVLDVAVGTGSLTVWEPYFLRFAPCFRASVAGETSAVCSLERIAELEARLRQLCPEDPLLLSAPERAALAKQAAKQQTVQPIGLPEGVSVPAIPSAASRLENNEEDLEVEAAAE